MKRVGNIYQRICSIENLMLADKRAQRGKRNQRGVKQHNRNRAANILALHKSLVNKTYRTSSYSIFTIKEKKERVIYRLPYYPDRIVHHAIMNVLGDMFVANFTADTYSCIKGRGIHKAFYKLKAALKDVPNTRYCLKLDIRKFYPSVDHDTLKAMLRRKIKDKDALWLIDGIIDSAEGLPIGNYLSQFLANFFLSGLDHWLKETKRIAHYYRYADDLVILNASKPFLHALLAEIRSMLTAISLHVKDNYQVFPVAIRGIDFIGYRFFSNTHIILRDSIKQAFAKMLHYNPNAESIASYNGWLSHCNARHLQKILLAQ